MGTVAVALIIPSPNLLFILFRSAQLSGTSIRPAISQCQRRRGHVVPHYYRLACNMVCRFLQHGLRVVASIAVCECATFQMQTLLCSTGLMASFDRTRVLRKK